MPHKHKRDPKQRGDYDLPPELRAAALPVGKRTATKGGDNKAKLKRKRARNQDDTPKAFQRIMARQQGERAGVKRPLSGLDDGDTKRLAKKRKNDADVPAGIKATSMNDKASTKNDKANTKNDKTNSENSNAADDLKIRPGERLADFGARVNQALPLAGLSNRTKAIDGMKEHQTRNEKKIQKKIKAWRVEEARRQDRAEDERDQQDLDDAADFNVSEAAELARRDRKARRRDADGDPWAQLKRARGQRPALADVALAPPELRVPTAKFKVKAGAAVDVVNVPARAGSLRQREALGSERRSIIEQYRDVMRRQRGDAS